MHDLKARDIWYRNKKIRSAFGEAIYDRMKEDPMVYLIGEGMEQKVHYDYPQIEADFPNRYLTMPIAEDGSNNFALGASLLGIKPILNIITSDFLFRTFDSICNSIAKTDYLYPGRTIVIMAEFMTGGPTTGARNEAMFCAIPQLRVAVPAFPIMAKVLMKEALMQPGVSIMFEDRDISDDWPEIWRWENVHPPSPRLTIVSYGLTAHQAYRVLRDNDRHDCDLVVLPTIYPINWNEIYYSLLFTRKLLILEPDIPYMGTGAEIAASIAEVGGIEQIRRLGMKRTVIPASMGTHESLHPSDEEVLRTIESMVK